MPATTVGAESLLDDAQFVYLVRWVFTARLVCLALAAPAALTGPGATLPASLSLCLLTVSSLVCSRSDRVIRTMIRHPLLASADVAVTITLLISIDSRQPAALTAICTALAAGLLFARGVLVVLMVPLALGGVGAAVLATVPTGWSAWLALLAGLPALVVGVCIVGSVVRHNVQALIQARQEVAEAEAAVGAADERARLARGMHDSVGKSIHGISLGAKALKRVVGDDSEAARELAGRLADAADQAAGEARALLVSLREGQIDRPTVDVVAELIEQWQADTGVRARLSTVRAVDAAPVVTSQMAHALGEILHNVSKHAAATEVDVVLTGDPDRIELSVTDNGNGFSAERPPSKEVRGHYGLRGLQERAEQVGGKVDITSAPGGGTSVRWTARRHPIAT
jgi:signal transduction histidine kinase